MSYVVALDFDYFDGDFSFGDLEKEPLLPEMMEDGLSEGYISVFSSYDKAVGFSCDLLSRICDRAVCESRDQEFFVGSIRSRMLAAVADYAESGEEIAFDLEQEYGNWEIRLRLLAKDDETGACYYPF